MRRRWTPVEAAEAAARRQPGAPAHPLRIDRPSSCRLRQVWPGPQQAARGDHAWRRAGSAQGQLVINDLPYRSAGLLASPYGSSDCIAVQLLDATTASIFAKT